MHVKEINNKNTEEESKKDNLQHSTKEKEKCFF